MARRRKLGRKIKHTKSLYRRKTSTKKKVLSFIIFIIIVAGIAFLGYSIAPTVIDFFKGMDNKDTSSSSEVWTPPDLSSVVDDSSDLDDISNVEPEPSEPDKTKPQGAVSMELNADVLVNAETLKSAVARAKAQGYTEVVVELKSQGGVINYNSTNATAIKANAVKGTMSAEEIVKIIKDVGLNPVAKMSVLQDHLAPHADINIGYVFANGGGQWLDNSPSNGGKPWISPFSKTAQVYANELVTEISKAGFTRIIATDLVFPNFYKTDLDYIGEIVKDSNRYKSLIAFANSMKSVAQENSATFIVEIPLNESLENKVEIYNPKEINVVGVSFAIDLKTMPTSVTSADGTVTDISAMGMYDKIKSILSATSSQLDSKNISPKIVVTGVSQNDISEALRAFNENGYAHYIIKE